MGIGFIEEIDFKILIIQYPISSIQKSYLKPATALLQGSHFIK